MAPIMVWDEEDGIAKHQVIILHTIALMRANSIASILNVYRLKSPSPIVLATAVPKIKGPAKFPIAAMERETLVEAACDAIMVATTVQLSLNPFMKAL